MQILKRLSLLFAFICMLISNNLFAQIKSAGKNNKPSTIINKYATNTKKDALSDSLALKIKSFLTRKTYDSIFLKDLPEYINSLSLINFINGKIFFSGNGFSQPIVATFYASLIQSKIFESFFSRCVSGSKIFLQDCVYKNTEGVIIRSFNRSIFII